MYVVIPSSFFVCDGFIRSGLRENGNRFLLVVPFFMAFGGNGWIMGIRYLFGFGGICDEDEDDNEN